MTAAHATSTKNETIVTGQESSSFLQPERKDRSAGGDLARGAGEESFSDSREGSSPGALTAVGHIVRDRLAAILPKARPAMTAGGVGAAAGSAVVLAAGMMVLRRRRANRRLGRRVAAYLRKMR